jgi:hypothetical protein
MKALSAGLLKLLSVLSFGLLGAVPPRDLTVTRMGVTEVRLRAYWRAHGRLPASLEELPTLKGRDNSTTDGWGRAIQYEVNEPSTVTLTSPGADGGPDPGQKVQVTFRVDKPPEG